MPFKIFILSVFVVLNAHAQSSSELRKNKSFQIVGQPAGLGPLTAYTTGLGFGVFLDSDSLIDMTYHHNISKNLAGSEYRVQIENFGTHYKKFMKNSFYFKTGLDYRRVTYEYNSNFGDGSLEENTQFKATALNASFALGNQWQWDTFTLGCDWVGAYVPLSTSTSNEYTAGSFSRNVRRLSDDERRYVNELTLYFAHFYLGVSF